MMKGNVPNKKTSVNRGGDGGSGPTKIYKNRKTHFNIDITYKYFFNGVFE